MGYNYPENSEEVETVVGDEDMLTLSEFLKKNWFRLVYYCVAFYCLLLPICFLITFMRSRSCCGDTANRINDFEDVVEMHRNGVEIDICRHLARIHDSMDR